MLVAGRVRHGGAGPEARSAECRLVLRCLVTDRERDRLIAWGAELRRVHQRLREALDVAQEELVDPVGTADPGKDLLLYCLGFCTALDGHHRGEDSTLFPAIEAVHPELAPVLKMLQQDHSMIAHLLGGLQAALDRAADRSEIQQHLDGIAAIMESHFRYEERMLLTVLEGLRLDADVTYVLGPL